MNNEELRNLCLRMALDYWMSKGQMINVKAIEVLEVASLFYLWIKSSDDPTPQWNSITTSSTAL